ncbi:MAG: insulinase family protein [Ruminococcus sp.]|nr:insulinase family protein [Ruminococcus sp.]
MAVTHRKRTVGEKDRGVSLTVLTDEKFKINSFVINFMSELTRENAAANAAAAFILEDSCGAYPDITSLSRRLAGLYGANIRTGISRFADSSVITVSGGCIPDRYALNGEEITYELLQTLLCCIFEPVTENGVFPQKEFELKRQELEDDIGADINDKRSYAFKQAGKLIYENEPAGIAVKGEREDVRALTSEKVYRAYKKLLSSAKIEIFFAGAHLPEKCERLIEERFGAMERENVYAPKISPSPLKNTVLEHTERLDVAQSKTVMAFKNDIYDPPLANVFGAVFGTSPFSMLFENVRERLSLCYYCSASFNSGKYVMYVDSGVEAENIEPAREEILRQLEAAQRGEFSDEMLEQAKLTVLNALSSVEDIPGSLINWYFSYCLRKEQSPEEVKALVKKMTRGDICRYASSYKPDTVYILTGKEND